MQSDTSSAGPSLLARRTSLYWRIHFWAALIASPFTIVAALTGLLYLFTPQIEAVLYERLDKVAPTGQPRNLDELVAAARAAAPAGSRLHSVAPAYTASDTTRVTFEPDATHAAHHGGHQHAPTVVYVNPYTAEVVGSLAGDERFSVWAKRLHSRLLQGDNWRWLIELAASWMVVMLATGVWLWWSRAGARVLPRPGGKGRAGWRQWHAFIGVALGIVSLVILVTGLTWSKHAGEQIRQARDATGQASPQPPSGMKSVVPAAGAPLDWQAAWETARRHAPDIALQLTPPRSPEDVWRAGVADRSQPTKRFDLVFDAYSGKPLYTSGWDELTAFGKATAVGIPFHRGEFGWWNQALLLVFGLGVLFSLVSGWVMFFRRRRTGTTGLPPLVPGAWRSVSAAACVTAVVMLVAMPLLAISAACVVLAEAAMFLKASKAG